MKKTLIAIAALLPLTTIADEDICKKLMADITRNYDVTNLKYVPNGNQRMN